MTYRLAGFNSSSVGHKKKRTNKKKAPSLQGEYFVGYASRVFEASCFEMLSILRENNRQVVC